MTVIVIGYNNLTGIQILLGFGYDKYFLYSILAGTTSNVILNLLLIPTFGAVGTAISAVSAEFVVLSVMLYYVYKYTPVRFVAWKETLFSIVIALSFFVIANIGFAYIEGWSGLFVIILICSLVYLGGQYLAGSKSESFPVKIEITGGEITIVMADGDTDGVDSNGDLIVSGGTINVTGSGAFDYDGNAEYTGGTIIINGTKVDTIPNSIAGGK